MKRHSVNVFSLVFGVALILLAAWIAFPTRGWLFGSPRWLPPTAVIVVGAALMSPLFTSRGDTGEAREESGPVDESMKESTTRPGEESTSARTADERDTASADLPTEA